MDSKAKIRACVVAGRTVRPDSIAYIRDMYVMLRHNWDDDHPEIFGAVIAAARELAADRSSITGRDTAVYSSKKVLLAVQVAAKPSKPPKRAAAKRAPASSKTVTAVVTAADSSVQCIAIEPITE